MTSTSIEDRADSLGCRTARTRSTTPPARTHRQILTVMSGLIIAMLLAQLDNMIVSPACRPSSVTWADSPTSRG